MVNGTKLSSCSSSLATDEGMMCCWLMLMTWTGSAAVHENPKIEERHVLASSRGQEAKRTFRSQAVTFTWPSTSSSSSSTKRICEWNPFRCHRLFFFCSRSGSPLQFMLSIYF
ncbi:uncharacterized protein [Musca autumnalis]|uniref:uncharacterized protein n=1 Tax=Musca autumnalis TaxID=221902 RepID=UPI003CEE3CEA